MTLDEREHVKRLAARRGMAVTTYVTELIAADAIELGILDEGN
jgi:hypothetical protein